MKGKRAQHNKDVLALRQAVANLMKSGQYQEALKKIQSRFMFGLKDDELAVEAARCCRRLNKQDEAQRYYNLALSIAPHNAGALNGLGLIHYERGNDAEAERCYQKALSIISDYPACRNNYGVLLHRMDRFDEAAVQYEAALASSPDYDDARYGAASVYGHTQKLEQAVTHLRQVLAYNPKDTRCATVLGMVLMQRGQYKEGWAHYRGRYCANNPYRFVKLPGFSQPYWQGEDLRGKTIMVHREQGLGDEIQFSRYVSRLKTEKGAAQVYLVCTKNSIPLLQQLSDIDGVIAHERGNKIPLFDYWIMLLDLPLHFCDSAAPFALRPPYFHAREEDIRRWPCG